MARVLPGTLSPPFGSSFSHPQLERETRGLRQDPGRRISRGGWVTRFPWKLQNLQEAQQTKHQADHLRIGPPGAHPKTQVHSTVLGSNTRGITATAAVYKPGNYYWALCNENTNSKKSDKNNHMSADGCGREAMPRVFVEIHTFIGFRSTRYFLKVRNWKRHHAREHGGLFHIDGWFCHKAHRPHLWATFGTATTLHFV